MGAWCYTTLYTRGLNNNLNSVDLAFEFAKFLFWDVVRAETLLVA